MNTINSYTPSLSFQSRCAEIKTGERVCHAITEVLPHQSDSKMMPFIKKLQLRDCAEEIKIKIALAFKRLYVKREDARMIFSTPLRLWGDSSVKPSRLFFQLTDKKDGRIGNCEEDAKAAEVILKMNGVENARTASLIRGGKICGHYLTVFNRDGSPFDGKVINNQTIIVDPWIGKVDFANNMFKFYENMCKDKIRIPEWGDFSLHLTSDTRITDLDKSSTKQFYPKLIFNK